MNKMEIEGDHKKESLQEAFGVAGDRNKPIMRAVFDATITDTVSEGIEAVMNREDLSPIEKAIVLYKFGFDLGIKKAMGV
mgnify:CR=1 FL=1